LAFNFLGVDDVGQSTHFTPKHDPDSGVPAELDLFAAHAAATDDRPDWLANPRVLRWVTADFGGIEALKAIVACPDHPSGEAALSEAVATAMVAGYSKPRDALSRVADRHKTRINVQNSGRYAGRGRPDRLFVTREGVNRLVLDSTKPEAARLKDWLAEDVLTAIEDTGSYTVPTRTDAEVVTLDSLELAHKQLGAALAIARQKEAENQQLVARNAVLEPMAEGYRHFLEADGTVKWANACEHLGVAPNLFGAHLRSRKILVTDEYTVIRTDGPEKRQGERHNRPYADYKHWFHFPAYNETEKLDRVPGHRQFDRRVTKAGMDGLLRELKRHVVNCGHCSMCESVRRNRSDVYSIWRPAPKQIGA
jgi:prophage antirepressor-like protein